MAEEIEGDPGWNKLRKMGGEEIKGQAKTLRKGTEEELSCSSWNMVHSHPSQPHSTHGHRALPAIIPSLPLPGSLNFSKVTMLCNWKEKDKLPVLKLEQSTAKGFEVAGASLLQYCDESPEKLHRRESFPQGQYLGLQISKFHKNQETTQIQHVSLYQMIIKSQSLPKWLMPRPCQEC